MLDKNQTTGIKHINSIVTDIRQKIDGRDRNYLMITTNEYLIKMGQDNSDSYYPRNFFDIDECIDFALEEE